MGLLDGLRGKGKPVRKKAPRNVQRARETYAWRGQKQLMDTDPELKRAYLLKALGIELPDPVEQAKRDVQAAESVVIAEAIKRDPEYRAKVLERYITAGGGGGKYGDLKETMELISSLQDFGGRAGGGSSSWMDVLTSALENLPQLAPLLLAAQSGQQGYRQLPPGYVPAAPAAVEAPPMLVTEAPPTPQTTSPISSFPAPAVPPFAAPSGPVDPPPTVSAVPPESDTPAASPAPEAPIAPPRFDVPTLLTLFALNPWMAGDQFWGLAIAELEEQGPKAAMADGSLQLLLSPHTESELFALLPLIRKGKPELVAVLDEFQPVLDRLAESPQWTATFRQRLRDIHLETLAAAGAPTPVPAPAMVGAMVGPAGPLEAPHPPGQPSPNGLAKA